MGAEGKWRVAPGREGRLLMAVQGRHSVPSHRPYCQLGASSRSRELEHKPRVRSWPCPGLAFAHPQCTSWSSGERKRGKHAEQGQDLGGQPRAESAHVESTARASKQACFAWLAVEHSEGAG